MSKNESVLGIYSSWTGVENAISVLKDSDFSHTAVSVLLPENLGSKELTTEKGTKAPEGNCRRRLGSSDWWHAGVVGQHWSTRHPGTGTFHRSGSDYGSPDRSGSRWRRGGVAGALVGLGIPEYEAKRYEGSLQRGGILVSLHCDTSDEINRAKEIMERTGAEDISSAGEASTDGKSSDTPSTKKAGTGY